MRRLQASVARARLMWGFAVTLLAAGTPVSAQPLFKMVPADSRVAFVSKQMGVPVEGQFRRFEVQVTFDASKPESSSVAMQVDTASATLGVPMIDMELSKAPWFDVARHPKADFHSTAVKALGDGRYEIAGRLSLKGHARELVVPVTLAQMDRRLVASGGFALRRLDFDVGDREWRDTSMVADEVQIRFKLTLAAVGGS